jgi:hypothetical protein
MPNGQAKHHFGRTPSNGRHLRSASWRHWRHDFGAKEASNQNRMVLLYAVPLALFAGTFTASRAELSQDIPLVIALCVATIGPREP